MNNQAVRMGYTRELIKLKKFQTCHVRRRTQAPAHLEFMAYTNALHECVVSTRTTAYELYAFVHKNIPYNWD